MDKSIVLMKAKSAVMSHDFITAARLYNELLAEDKENVEYLKQLGSIYVQAGQDEKAIPYYQKIIEIYPHFIDAMNSLGAIFRRLKRYDDSIAVLQRALDEDRQVPSVNYNLGFTYKEMGFYSDAIEAFKMVVESNPDDVLAYNHLGSIYCSLKDYDKSMTSYKRGLQIDRNHPILNYNLAHVYELVKNYADAIKCYQLTLKTKPGWIEAIKDYSNLLTHCQKNKEAQEIVEHAIKLYPNNAALLCSLGNVFLNEYDFSGAEKTFKKADSLKGRDIEILSGLAKALERNEKIEDALETIETAYQINSEDKDVKKQYAGTLLTNEKYSAALENINELYESNGQKDVEVLDLYGQYYICTDDEEKASQYYEKINRIDHHYKDYMINAANRCSQKGDYSKAEAYANKFVESRPQHPEGYNTLGNICMKKGDLEAAQKHFSKCAALRSPNVHAKKQLEKIGLQLTEVTAAEEPVVESNLSENELLLQNAGELEAVTEAKEELKEQQIPIEDDEFDMNSMGDDVPEEEVPETEELEEEEEVPSLNDLTADDDTENPFDMFGDDEEDEEEEDFFGTDDNEVEEEEHEPDKADFSTEDSLLDFEEPVRKEPPKRQLPPEPFYEPEDNSLRDFSRKQKDLDSMFTEKAEMGDLLSQIDEPAPEPEKPVIQEVPEVSEVSKEQKEELPVEETAETESEPAVKKAESEVLTAQGMLEKIERILNDDESALNNSEKIELFKKLRILCSFLPETEKNTFACSRMLMMIEYIISKLSGKPGLLAVSMSLLKSGALGNEYSAEELYDKDFEVTNEVIKQVFRSLKKLSGFLEDEELAKILINSADFILERVELEDQKSQIF